MNDTLELLRAQVKVRYVNDPKPGKKMGTIKTYEDEYFYVRNDMLRIFHADETYDLGYTETQGNNGLPLRTVQKASAVKSEAENYPSRQAARRETNPHREAPEGSRLVDTPREPPRQPQNGNGGNGWYRPTHPRDAERMFVCATLGHFIDRGTVKSEVAELVDVVNVLREVWRVTFGVDDA